MRKIFVSIFTVLLLLGTMMIPVSAAPPPAFTLTAPTNVYASLVDGDSPTTVQIAFSLDNSVTTWFSNKIQAIENETIEDFMKIYNVDDIDLRVQIDWALDDVDDPVSGWGYNEYWDGTQNEYGEFGKDAEGNIHYTTWDTVDLSLNNPTETVQTYWVTRGVLENEWNGDKEAHIPALKDRFNPDQCTYDTEAGVVNIDFSQHTLYFRVRFVEVKSDSDADGNPAFTYRFSDWSDTCKVGKEADAIASIKGKDVKPPVITNLRLLDESHDFNDNPVVAFTLEVPEELQTQLSQASGAGGGIFIETYARVKGDSEWTSMGNTDGVISSGERECALLHLVNDERPTISRDTEIELRCRYLITQPGMDDEYSDFSNVISFGTDDISVGEEKPTDVVTSEDPVVTIGTTERSQSPFMWIVVIILAIVIIASVCILISSKNKKKNEE